MIPMPLLKKQVEQHPYPLLFATISGAHLYGFPSPDSDFHVGGVHLLPLKEVIGLRFGPETVERSKWQDGRKIDLVTDEAKKFFRLLLERNGAELERVFSPLVVHTTPEHAELKEIAAQCISRQHVHYYLSFAERKWKTFEKKKPRHSKHLLYAYRLVLTGIHLMQTGMVEMNMARLNETAKLSYLDDLIALKRDSSERRPVVERDLLFHRSEYRRLRDKLYAEYEKSDLPEAPRGSDALHDLLVRLRLKSFENNQIADKSEPRPRGGRG